MLKPTILFYTGNSNHVSFLCFVMPCTTLQVRVLGRQLDEMQAGKQELVTKYEGQLQHVKEEVSNFKMASDTECWLLRLDSLVTLIGTPVLLLIHSHGYST